MTLTVLVCLAVALGLAARDSSGFGEIVGACEADCRKCHSITMQDAARIVKEVNPEIEVLDIRLSPVGGLWEITIKARGKRGLAYIDFSKEHIITGSVIQVATRENLTNRRLYDLNKVDVSKIPLDDALVMGNPKARFRAIVFDDPDCPYCRKLHRELQQIVQDRDDMAFYIKLLPLKIHPAAYKKAKAILCEKSLRMLERAFDGKPLPEPTCESSEADENIALAERLGITSTPTIILPDGGVVAGFKDAASLAEMIETSGVYTETNPSEGPEGPEGADAVMDKDDFDPTSPPDVPGTDFGPAFGEETDDEAE